MSQKTMKNSVHLHEVLKEVLISLAGTGPPRTHLCKDQLSADPVMSRLNLLEEFIDNDCSPITSNGESGTAQCDHSCEEHEGDSQMADEIDRGRPICTTQEDSASFKKWESTQQFAKVVKTYLKYLFGFSWDKEACKYKIAEPVEISSGLDDYAEYAFVVRERVERNSEEVMPYIDIKSEDLRDNLREVLYGIKAISLMEDKPSIEQNILFHFLPELDKYAENMNNSECEFLRQHLRLLIDHLKQAYLATS
ncbi:hypothetical protein PENDEC_c021G01998 [Penicillium decumbens]|uniref:Uncharacterized protein n=1 Tax=Penicillium decumbens TaxID=69771 RepID=A0A1V6P6Q8_PENDC|nr:hypothetical protein PENDEC_c021G01998 [Penicillium decumbens]